MNFFTVCKNILVSFLVTTSIYFGFVPFVLFKPLPIETTIELPRELPSVHYQTEPFTLAEAQVNIESTPTVEKIGPDASANASNGPTTEPLVSERQDQAVAPAPQASQTKKSSRKQRIKSRSGKKRNCTVANPDIRKINSRSYVLPKRLLRHYSRNWGEASKLAYLGWSKDRQGSVRGVKIRHISCDSPLPYAGLERGDVVLAVNGKSITSNAKLMKLYPLLFRWRTIELTVLRDGRPMKIHYQVVA